MARRPSKAADDSLNIPQSTGAVEFDASPDEWGITADNSSTGAYETGGATMVTQGYLDAPVTVNVETPGPVTVTSPYFAETKVIQAPASVEAVASDVVPETKDAEPPAEAAPVEPQPEPAAEAAPEVF